MPPDPITDPADVAFVPVARRWVSYHHFAPESHAMAKAVRTWLFAKGYASVGETEVFDRISAQEADYVEPKISRF